MQNSQKKTGQSFEGFSKETGEFFWELVFHNERSWFLEHREQFEKYLYGPFKALSEETGVIMHERYPDAEFDVHASRIYRDARRLYGRGPYKESLWFSIKHRADGMNAPSFFFEITPKDWSFGMGCYCLRSAELENFRKSIDAEPERFRRIAEGIDRLPGFIVEGEEYRRPKGDYGETINRWYNRKWASAVKTNDFGGELFSSDLPEILSASFEKLMPMYEYLRRFCREEV